MFKIREVEKYQTPEDREKLLAKTSSMALGLKSLLVDHDFSGYPEIKSGLQYLNNIFFDQAEYSAVVPTITGISSKFKEENKFALFHFYLAHGALNGLVTANQDTIQNETDGINDIVQEKFIHTTIINKKNSTPIEFYLQKPIYDLGEIVGKVKNKYLIEAAFTKISQVSFGSAAIQ